MIRIRLIAVLFMILPFITETTSAQVVLTLDKTIELATDSSLQSFRLRNRYLASYWEHRSFKAARLPSLSLDLTPGSYYRANDKVYTNDQWEYRKQEYYIASGGLNITQNLDLLGGTFSVNTDLEYLRDFQAKNNVGGHKTQFNSVPVQIAYYQDLLGYNPFKWERKIQPLKFQKAKKELIYNMEQVSEIATEYFFQLAMAQAEYDLSVDNVASSDTLYRIAQEKHKIAAITQGELLRLRLDAVNAKNKLQNNEISLKKAMFTLATYLNMDKNAQIRLTLPNRPRNMEIPVDRALSYAQENNPTLLGKQQSILEAERSVDETKKRSMFDAKISAQVGFNRIAYKFQDAYSNPSQREIISLTLSIPLVDWGVRKGKYNMARNELIIAQIEAREEETSIEEEVIMTISNFNIQQDLIQSAEEALGLSIRAYEEAKQRFMIGKEDVNTLMLSWEQQQNAQRNYIESLRNYWLSYFQIRRLTLFDFDMGLPLSAIFDYENGF